MITPYNLIFIVIFVCRKKQLMENSKRNKVIEFDDRVTPTCEQYYDRTVFVVYPIQGLSLMRAYHRCCVMHANDVCPMPEMYSAGSFQALHVLFVCFPRHHSLRDSHAGALGTHIYGDADVYFYGISMFVQLMQPTQRSKVM